MSEWKRGLPPGELYDGMVDDYEVYFSPGGAKWHRERSAEDAAAFRNRRLAREEAISDINANT